MDSDKNDTTNPDLTNYRILAEAVKNNQRLTLSQQEQLTTLARKLKLPNPLTNKAYGLPGVQAATPATSEYLERAKKSYEEEDRKASRKGWISTIVNAVQVIGGALILAFVINHFVFQPYQVVGISMQNTLHDGDRLIVSKAGKTWSKISRRAYMPSRYDIIVLKSDEVVSSFDGQHQTQLVKRVIGLPGDRVVVQNGRVTIYNESSPNGFNPDENLPTKNIPTDGNIDLTVPDKNVFVLGDNRPNSRDSRVQEIGPVPVENVVGIVRMRLLPLSQAQFF